MSSRPDRPVSPQPTDLTLPRRLVRQARQLICGVGGHDMLMHFDKKRVSLVCTNCDYESPGWKLPGASEIRQPSAHR